SWSGRALFVSSGNRLPGSKFNSYPAELGMQRLLQQRPALTVAKIPGVRRLIRDARMERNLGKARGQFPQVGDQVRARIGARPPESEKLIVVAQTFTHGQQLRCRQRRAERRASRAPHRQATALAREPERGDAVFASESHGATPGRRERMQ